MRLALVTRTVAQGMMFDYSKQIEAFREKRVRLPATFKEKLLSHRASNRTRLINRLPDHLAKVRLGQTNFKPQGSVAMGTIIQTKFVDEEYDIDDGLVISRSQLTSDDGGFMSANEVREAVREVLKDKRFNRQPKLFTNCVRVFYAEEDEEKHHVDFPVYRRWTNDDGDHVRELASNGKWVVSDPTQVNAWFDEVVASRNRETEGRGTQFRQLIQLIKRYCRSRKDWLDLLPNGMKLTMLVAECQPSFDDRIDRAFRHLLKGLQVRLGRSKVIHNLAHPDLPMITRTLSDANVVELLSKVDEALERLIELDDEDAQNVDSAREVWDWIFKSDGFFRKFDQAVSRDESTSNWQESRFDVPWRQKPPWPMNIEFELTLAGRYSYSKESSSWNYFVSDAPPLEKHLYLRFKADTDVPKPYEVFWQVVNTGREAAVAGGLRGEIVASSSAGAGGLHSTTAIGPLREDVLFILECIGLSVSL